LLYATLSGEPLSHPERTALTLLRGGTGAAQAAQQIRSALVQSGAGAAETDQLVWSVDGLFSADQPEVPNVAAAVTRYNELIMAAPPAFLVQPPAELMALRISLGRFTAAANGAVASERVYPGLPRAQIRYANGATWLQAGVPLQVLGATYVQHGAPIHVGERAFKRVTDFNGVWVLAEEPVAAVPATVYVPLRTYCDIELLPFAVQEKVIKRSKS
jgi:hypothetical protein